MKNKINQMKALITTLLIIIASVSYSQTYLERRLNAMPPEWVNGMSLEEIFIDRCTGRYSCKISEGTFYKLHKESTNKGTISINIDIENVLYNFKTLLIWVENGKLKYSLEGIKSKNKNDIFILWRINITVLNGKIYSVDSIDLRGLSLDKSYQYYQ